MPRLRRRGRRAAALQLRPEPQPTPNQQRRMEDARGTNRDGARQRFKSDLARRRERKPGGPGKPGS